MIVHLWAAVALLAAEPAEAPPAKRMFVAPLEARLGVSPRQVEVITDFLVGQARRVPGYSVVSQADIEQLLSLEMKQQLTGCNATSCLAEIGGALDAEEVLYGSVGRLGETELVLSLTRIDPRSASAIAGEAARLSGASEDAVLDRVAGLLDRLYPEYEPPPARVQPMRPWLLLPIVTALGGAVQYALFASIITSGLFAFIPVVQQAIALASLGACLMGPFGVSYLQAWLLDVIGRRQAGVRYVALLGWAVMGAAVALSSVVFAAISGVTLAIASVQALGELIATQDPASAYYTIAGAIGTLIGAMFIVGPLLALTVVVVMPAAQALMLYFSSQERPVDAEPVLPGLYGPREEVPSWMPSWVPSFIVGGKARAGVVLVPDDGTPLEKKGPAPLEQEVLDQMHEEKPAEKGAP